MRKKFKNIKIGQKLLLGNIGIIFIMTLFMGIMGYIIPRNILLERSKEQSQTLMNQMSDNFNYAIRAIEGVVTSETFNSDFSSLLKNNPVKNQYSRKKDIQTYGNNLISFQKNIQYVLVGDGERNIYSISREKDILTKEEKEQLLDYDTAYKLWGITLWKPYNENMVFATKLIFDYGNMQPIGVVSIGVDVSYFSGIYKEITGNGNGIVVLNKYDDILFSNDSRYLKLAKNVLRNKNYEDEKEITFGKENYIYTMGKVKDERIQVMNFLSVGEITRTAKEKLLPSFLLAAVFSVVLSSGLAAAVSGQVAANIKLLLKSIERISHGDFSEKIVPESYDEIGMLAENFNNMADQIQLLLQTVSNEKIQKKNSEIRALQFEYDSLQAKINPHFLYNTLESINCMAKLQGQERIGESICMLGNYLRETISSKRKYVTVREEIDNISQYIAIQKLSYGDKIQAKYEVAEALEDAIVPKLILQPLVENSIVHGIDQKNGVGHIKVTVKGDGTDMLLTVVDDGVGIPGGKLKSVMQSDTEDKKHTKVGLYAVDKRVRILYGNEYGIGIESSPGKETRVCVRIPIRFEDVVES